MAETTEMAAEPHISSTLPPEVITCLQNARFVRATSDPPAIINTMLLTPSRFLPILRCLSASPLPSAFGELAFHLSKPTLRFIPTHPSHSRPPD